MKIKTLCFIIIFLSFFLFACEKQLNAESSVNTISPTISITHSWQEMISDSFLSYKDAKGNIYFSYDEQEIWRVDNATQESTLMITGLYYGLSFCINDNYIYYFTPEKTLVKASIENPSEKEVVLSQEQLGGFGAPKDLAVCGDFFVYRDIGTIAYLFDLKKSERYQLHDDVDSMAIWNNKLYFVEHARRTFSLYRKPLDQPDAQPELLLGKGSTWHNEDSGKEFSIPKIYSVYVEDDRLFFTQNNGELWEFKEDGKHKLIKP